MEFVKHGDRYIISLSVEEATWLRMMCGRNSASGAMFGCYVVYPDHDMKRIYSEFTSPLYGKLSELKYKLKYTKNGAEFEV